MDHDDDRVRQALPRMPSFLSPLLRNPGTARRLVNTRNGAVLATELYTAFDSVSRRKGLLDHHALADGAALVIAPCSAVHTIGMRFPIDIAFVSRAGRLLKVRHAVKPWRLSGALGAFAVVELAAGALARAGVVPGDSLEVG